MWIGDVVVQFIFRLRLRTANCHPLNQAIGAEIHGVDHVLPAHGHPFKDLPARTEAIKRHHQERLDKVREISRAFGKPESVAAFTRQLFRKRSWGSMAESETYAHLEHLRHAGDAERRTDSQGRFVYQTG